VPTHVRARLDKAKAGLDRDDSALVAVLSAGTPHKPGPPDPRRPGFVLREAEAEARYLLAAGVAPERILEEALSLDTVGNAYMLRTIHTDPQPDLRRLVVVTNKWHMERVRAIFSHVFSIPPWQIPYELEFDSDIEDGLPPEVVAVRSEREHKSAVAFRNTAAKTPTLALLHKFMFSDHMAYAAARHTTDHAPVDPVVLKSY